MDKHARQRRFRSLLAGLFFALAGKLDAAYDVWLDDAPRRNAPQHVHLWDTERDEDLTYVPPAGFDTPWVIHECIDCGALKVTRERFEAVETVEFLPVAGS